MRWSRTHLKTFREKPAQAETPGHVFLLRGGYIVPLSAGLFVYGALFLRSLQKLSAIIRDEMEKTGAQEILMPMVQPKELWMETGRWNQFQDLLLKAKNRAQKEFCLGPTHEEAVTAFARKGLSGSKDLPFCVYQIQTKYRDELRPRAGLLRAKEFIMKDGYSFDKDKKSALQSYRKMQKAYTAIFQRIGARFVTVRADAGLMGGSESLEFHFLSDQGEDTLLTSDKSAFAANREICPTAPPEKTENAEPEREMEKFASPKAQTVKELAKLCRTSADRIVKIVFVKGASSNTLAGFLCAGDREIHLTKAGKAMGEEARLAGASETQKETGAGFGSCGPVGLRCPVYADHALKYKKNFITGANQDGFHLKNVNFKDFSVKAFGDFVFAKAKDPSPCGQGVLREQKGIEAGHLFYLSQTYSKSMGLFWRDSGGGKAICGNGMLWLGRLPRAAGGGGAKS